MTTNAYIPGFKNNGWPPFSGKLWQRNFKMLPYGIQDILRCLDSRFCGNDERMGGDDEKGDGIYEKSDDDFPFFMVNIVFLM
jgi:hypothetical protein